MKNSKNFPNKILKKTDKILLPKLKQLELENKLLKEQLEKAFPVFKLENIKTWRDIWNYLKKKYGKEVWWVEFLIILCIKDVVRWILITFKIAPSDLLSWIFKSLKGVN